ncbi:MAG TPA: hypothetical protein IAA30_08815 [Candidatus Treponema faecavium]|nr:hypothetical protein [Candidatus Treponema faecavium]
MFPLYSIYNMSFTACCSAVFVCSLIRAVYELGTRQKKVKSLGITPDIKVSAL